MIDSVDGFIMTMPSLINRRRRVLFPVVLQRGAMARDLAHYLGLLGLERRKLAPKQLGYYLAEKYSGQPDQAEAPADHA